MKKRLVVWSLSGVVAISVLAIGWRVAWRYDDVNIPYRDTLGYAVVVKRTVRTHLITGQVQALRPDGWRAISTGTRNPGCSPSLSNRVCAALYEEP